MGRKTKFEIIKEIIKEGIKEKYQNFSLNDIDFDLVEELVNAYYAGILSKDRLDELIEDFFKKSEKIY